MQDMSIQQFARQVSELAPRLMRSMWYFGRNYYTRGLISYPQLWALEHLYRHKECTMHDLADTLGTRGSTTTGLVDRLIKMKLANRRHSEKDRRVVFVAITPKGRQITRQIISQHQKTMMGLFAKLSPRDRKQYVEILEKLVGGLLSETKAEAS